jgi:single-stranded-DNA-specific exonuclease
LPTRTDGYGLNARAIEEFVAAGASLLIAVDCGSTDAPNIEIARSRGLDVIVLDHHHIGDRAPDGAIIVSAYLVPDGRYRELSAVGVAYLLVSALAQEGYPVGGRNGEPETGLLDLVVLGTIADIAPLTGVNRLLVRHGLQRIRSGARPGLAALCRVANVDPAHLTSMHVAYRLVPRLNAAGRVADPHRALDLLLTDDPASADRIVREIEEFNSERRLRSQAVVDEAIGLVTAEPGWEERRVLVACMPDWPAGVLGPAASRLVDEFGRPVVVLTTDGEVARGSARSVPGVNIVEALERCQALLSGWGGHSQAAGLTVPVNNVPALWEALEAYLAEQGLTVPLEPRLQIESDLPLERLTLESAQLIDQLQPFGAGNEPPVLRLRRVQMREWQCVGQNQEHLRLMLAGPRQIVPAIFFGATNRVAELQRAGMLDLAVSLSVDRWNGDTRLNVEVKDFRATSETSLLTGRM